MNGYFAAGAGFFLAGRTITRPPLGLFEEQVKTVFDKVDLRPERLTEIINQIGIPMQFWAAVLDLNPVNHRYTLELLFVALQMASHVNQFAKHAFGCPRPSAYSPAIQPAINPRRFGAFPSGHATEAYLVARILQRLSRQKVLAYNSNIPSLDMHLRRLAHRIADNREVAGVHFPIDSAVGRMVGETLAEYFVYRCETQWDESSGVKHDHGTPWQPRNFIGAETIQGGAVITLEFNQFEQMDMAASGTPQPKYFGKEKPLPAGPGPYQKIAPPKSANVTPLRSQNVTLLHTAWKRAEAEWASF